ncbi:uncharacterized protein BT62DRAFT_1081582 [Guyanagaster necrorhizus]|uniref:Uncharacterized protein n=1 Tax=Guyanagaster necrorhizus TaxID=856835 RepID=A0A9P8AM30_9AGAR|nr:uncharacterized protein BT62DRAFT_1081582 [Guyanagaster necrorhizus MCA 3950]KAG7439447.1 hypothetical protein BT62DRAFT_1081582 [Guyanagaster necrorhizus MCA 3950]
MQQRRDTGPGLGILDLKGNNSNTPVTPQRTDSRPLGDEPAPSNSAGTRPSSRSENDPANRINHPAGYPISTGPQVQPYGGALGQSHYPAIRFVDQSGGPQGMQSRPMIPTSVMAPRVQPPQKPAPKTSSKSESNGASRAPSRTRPDPVPSPSISMHPSPVETRRDPLPRQAPNPPLNFQYEHGAPVPSPSTSMRSPSVEPRQNSTACVPNTPLSFQYDLPSFRHTQSQPQLAPAPQRRHNGDHTAPPDMPSAQRRHSDQSMASVSSTTPTLTVGPSPTLSNPFSSLGPASAPPFIRDLTGSVLGHIQSKFEEAWTANVGAFQGEVTKLFKELERAQETIGRLRKERDDARDTAHHIAIENERLMVQLDHAQRTKGPGPTRLEPQVRIKEEQKSAHPSSFDMRKPLTPAEESKPTTFPTPTMIRFSSPSVSSADDAAARRRVTSPILSRSMEQQKHTRRSSMDKEPDNKGMVSVTLNLPRFSQLDLPAIKTHSPAPERTPFKNNQPLPSPYQSGPLPFKGQPPHPPNSNHILPQLQPPSQQPSPHDRPGSSNQMSRPGTSHPQYRTDTSSPIAPPFKGAPPPQSSYRSQQSPVPERGPPPFKNHPPPNQTLPPHHPGTPNPPPSHSSPPQHPVRPHPGPSNQHQGRIHSTPMAQHQRRPSGSDHASPPHQPPQTSLPQQHQPRTHMSPPPPPPPPMPTQAAPLRPFKRNRATYESDHPAEPPTSSPPDAKVTKTAHQTGPREPSVKSDTEPLQEPQVNGGRDSDKEQRPPDPEPGPSVPVPAPAPAPPPPPLTQGRAPFKASSSSNAAPLAAKKKLGIKHLDLLYETRDDQMVCRMNSTQTPRPPPRRFPLSAPWADLHRHYEETHPAECQDMEKLSSDSLAEMSVRQRMGVGKGGVKGHSKS